MPTLLLVDDSAIVQRMITMTCAAEGITVTAVGDGEEAVSRIDADRPDIVLASTSTPRRSGYDVAAFVAATPSLSRIPVILLAGAFEAIDEARAARARSAGILVKPFEPVQLLTLVRECLARRSPSTSPPDVLPAANLPAVSTSNGDDEVDDYLAHLDAALARRTAVSTPIPPPSADDATAPDVPTLDTVLEPEIETEDAAPRQTISAPEVSDALVEAVTQRVLERLAPGAVHAVVADVVADVADRLIREEIARIRAKR